MTTTLDMARFYEGLGVGVIPLQPQSKEPALRWGAFQTRRADTKELVRWFSKGNKNIAAVCGSASENLGIRDFDVADSYFQWRDAFPDEAESLPTVKTARGFHVWVRTESPIPSRCLDDGEFRSHGSYAIAPPSLHPNGVTYTWTKPPHDWIPIVDPVSVGLVPLLNASSALGVTQEIGFLCDTSTPSKTPSPRSSGPKHISQVGIIARASQGIITDHDELVADLVSRAIRKSQPSKVGQRHRCIFELVRYLKQIETLAGREPDYEIFKRWFNVAVPAIGTKDFQESWKDFDYAWRHVKVPKGKTLRSAAERANVDGVDPSVRGNKKRRLVAICAELQRLQGEKPFYLDCRNAGLIIDVGYKTAFRMLKQLCEEGILVKVSSGSYVSGRANEYKYNALKLANMTSVV